MCAGDASDLEHAGQRLHEDAGHHGPVQRQDCSKDGGEFLTCYSLIFVNVAANDPAVQTEFFEHEWRAKVVADMLAGAVIRIPPGSLHAMAGDNTSALLMRTDSPLSPSPPP